MKIRRLAGLALLLVGILNLFGIIQLIPVPQYVPSPNCPIGALCFGNVAAIQTAEFENGIIGIALIAIGLVLYFRGKHR